MKDFFDANLSLRQKIRLYRLLYTLSNMSFRYLLPVIFGMLAFVLIAFGILIPESFFSSKDPSVTELYYMFTSASLLCFLLFFSPYVKKIITSYGLFGDKHKK